MIVVVADTSPLNYLVRIHGQDLLFILYERVLVPTAVIKELDDSRTPVIVRAWLSHLPEWIDVREVLSPPDAALMELGPGEREAIQLAHDEHADLLLIDERIGVSAARRRGLAVTGTLGVLIQAARYGSVDIEAALRDLQTTDFRCTEELYQQARDLAKRSPI